MFSSCMQVGKIILDCKTFKADISVAKLVRNMCVLARKLIPLSCDRLLYYDSVSTPM